MVHYTQLNKYHLINAFFLSFSRKIYKQLNYLNYPLIIQTNKLEDD